MLFFAVAFSGTHLVPLRWVFETWGPQESKAGERVKELPVLVLWDGASASPKPAAEGGCWVLGARDSGTAQVSLTIPDAA